MYYAIYRAYGLYTRSSSDFLVRFKTKKQRNDYVSDQPWNQGVYQRISRDAARKRFPKAFSEEWPIIRDECFCTDYGKVSIYMFKDEWSYWLEFKDGSQKFVMC